MVAASHHGSSAKSLDRIQDAFVVCGHVGFAQHAHHLFVDSLNDWFAAKHS